MMITLSSVKLLDKVLENSGEELSVGYSDLIGVTERKVYQQGSNVFHMLA